MGTSPVEMTEQLSDDERAQERLRVRAADAGGRR